MGRKTVIPKYTNLGGLVLRKNDPLVEGNEAQIADNVIFTDKWGSLKQRDGFNARLASPVSGDKVRVIHQHITRQTGAKQRLILRGTTISRINDTVEVPLETGLVSSSLVGASAQLFDDSIICTGADSPRVFNSFGLSTVDTQAFRPQWCVNFANFMVYGGDATLPQRIVFSALGDAKSVDSTGDFIDILDPDSKLTGAFTLFNSLYVLSLDTITKIDGSDFTATSPGFDAQVRTIWRGTGSVNHQSIVVAHDRAYWLGRYGIFEFDGRQVKEISETVQQLFADRINRNVIDVSVSVHDQENNLVVFSVPSVNSEVPNTHAIYHYETALFAWATWSGFEATYWYQMEEAGNFPLIWHGDSDGQVFRHGGEADDNFVKDVPTAIFFRYKTGWQHFNGPAKRFIPKNFYPIVNGVANDTFIVEFFANYSSAFAAGFPKTLTIPATGPLWGAVTWNAFVWGGADAEYVAKVGVQASVVRNFAIEFQHESVGKRFAIIGWSTTIIPKGLTDGNQ